jgi:hypothetical protein
MKLLKKIKKYLKYHIGPKEVAYTSEFAKFLPQEFIDYKGTLYVVKVEKEKDKEYLTAITSEYEQRYNV